MKKLLAIGVALLLAILVFGCQGQATKQASSGDSSGSETSEPIKIGAVVSATGPAAPLGEPEKKALEMEVKSINSNGGVDGRDIELILEDDQSKPENAVTAVDKLIDQGCVAIIGGTTSSSTLAMKARTAQAKVPHISMAAGTKITEKPSEWIFRTAQSDALVVKKVINYMKDSAKIKKFAILHDSNAFGQSGADELQKLAADSGLEVTSVQSYKTEDTNVTSQLTKIKGTKPEAIVVWGTNPGPAVAAKNMKELGIELPYIGSHGIANMSFIQLAGGASEGVVFSAGKILVPESASGEQAKIIEQFMEDYKATYNENANHFAGHAYDAIHIIASAIKKTGTDPEKLKDEIEKTKDFIGIGGIFSYSAGDHDGTQESDLIMIQIKDGKWVEKK